MAAAKASLQKYIASQTRLGRDIRRSAIFAALHVEGFNVWSWLHRWLMWS